MIKRAFILAVISLAFVPLAAKDDKPQAIPVSPEKAEMYQLMVGAIKALHADQKIPKTKHELELTFKPEEYFNLLKHISWEEPWQLGFIYCRDPKGASPILLTYRSQEEKKSLGAEITKNYRSSKVYTNDFYWPHIKLDGTDDGYFEYLVLSLLGSQFSLWWCANYNDIEIICTRAAIEPIVKVTKPDEQFIKESKLVDPTPSFLIDKEQMIVRIVVFTKWGGFIERQYHISTLFPHEIKKIKSKVLAKLNCGVVLEDSR